MESACRWDAVILLPSVHRAVPVGDYRAVLGESPLWDEAVGLRWLDVDGRRLFTLAEGVATCVVLAERVSAVELTAGRELLAVVADGFAMLDPDTGSVLSLARAVAERTATMNDAGVDPHGRCSGRLGGRRRQLRGRALLS